MRKLLLTLMALCFLSGLSMAGLTPPSMAAARGAPASAESKDCDHHAPKESGDKESSGHAKMECCAAGYCPMLGQGVLPEGAPQLAFDKSLPFPIVPVIRSGLVRPPSLRPPRLPV